MLRRLLARQMVAPTLIMAALAGSASARPLFTDLGEVEAALDAANPAFAAERALSQGVVRYRAVGLDVEDLLSLPESREAVELNFFEDAVHTVRFERREDLGPGRANMYGKLRGLPEADVVLSVADGAVVGTAVGVDGKTFSIYSRGEGAFEIQEIDQSLLPPCGTTPTRGTATARPAPLFPAEGSEPPAAADETPQVPGESGTVLVLDVLIVWTPAAEAAQGSAAAMLALAQNSIALSNTAYSNSDIFVQLRLVGTGQVSYTETTNIGLDLDRLVASGDGFMDAVHTLRDTVHADQVGLLRTSDPNFCGVAQLRQAPAPMLATDDEYGFSVTTINCAVGNLSFPHELGHNAGLNHARVDPVSPTPLYPYAFGHKFIGADTNKYRTVMAYPDTTPPGGTRIAWFSNPNINFQSTPTGIAETEANSAFNARVLNLSSPAMAKWRVGPTGQAHLNSNTFDCEDTVVMTVIDSSIAGGGPIQGLVTTSAGDSEQVTLTESPASSGIFSGSINIVQGTVSQGTNAIEHSTETTLTATYVDANDGTGASGNRTATATVAACVPILTLDSVFVEAPAGLGTNNGNVFIESGESPVIVRPALDNTNMFDATNVTGELESLTPTAAVIRSSVLYPQVSMGFPQNPMQDFLLYIDPAHPCGDPVELMLTATHDDGVQSFPISIATGVPLGVTPVDVDLTGIGGVPIPTDNTALDIPINVPDLGVITDLNVFLGGTSCSTDPLSTTVGIAHSWVGDLNMWLISPAGTTVRLMEMPGGSTFGSEGNNFCQTLLDDDLVAGRSIQSIATNGTESPHSGVWYPLDPLSALDGEEAAGIWTLRVLDTYPDDDDGRVYQFSLGISAGFFCDPPAALPDMDADGRPDDCETISTSALSAGGSRETNRILPDSDLDGLVDGLESLGDCYATADVPVSTDPRNRDTDNDGFLDGLEVRYPSLFVNGPLATDHNFDNDHDGVPNSLDPHDGTDDADGDGFRDEYEGAVGTDMASAASRPWLGNVSGDSSGGTPIIDVNDVILLANYNVGVAILPNPGAGDLNGDAIIDINDVIILANFNVGLVATLPAY